ncbi:MAG: hypothetical protein FWE03_06495 [Firmicutes bacterium]|nr:hypothetical protein [Bacillota bacterium]
MSSNFNPPNRSPSPHGAVRPPTPPKPNPTPPSRPQPHRPHPPMPPPPQGPRPQRPNWPHGRPPQRPPMPNAPRPPHQSALPFGFSILSQARIGIIFSPHRSVQRWSMRFSQPIDRIPNNTFIWVFGERNGWSLVHFNGQFGFVDSRFVFLI